MATRAQQHKPPSPRGIVGTTVPRLSVGHRRGGLALHKLGSRALQRAVGSDALITHRDPSRGDFCRTSAVRRLRMTLAMSVTCRSFQSTRALSRTIADGPRLDGRANMALFSLRA
jgi:hypothetical protein